MFFEELLPVDLFSPSMDETALEQLPAQLQALGGSAAALAARQEQLTCACRAAFWPWVARERRVGASSEGFRGYPRLETSWWNLDEAQIARDDAVRGAPGAL